MQAQLIEASIESLSTVKSPREWEKRLGLSPGYLSRLKGGKESSVALTTLLAFLSRAPGRMWTQLETIWSGQAETQRSAQRLP